MAYDEELAERVRALIDGEPGVSEKRMFGGLALFVNGNMAVTIRGKGGLMVRVDPVDVDAVLAERGAETAVMGGRAMTGWITVEPEACAKAADLRRWVRRGTTYARTLPAK